MADDAPCLVHRHELTNSVGGLRVHVRGETRHAVTDASPDMFDGDGKRLGVELLCQPMSRQREAALRAERKASIKGKNGAPAKTYAELLFVAGRRVGQGWTPDMARQWAAQIPGWIASRYPDSPLVDCALHLDESQYHVHALIFPRGRSPDGELVWGMTAASRLADSLITGAPVAKRFDLAAKKAAASRLQDDAWGTLGAPFGLGRGERGSTRKTKALSDVERGKRAVEEAEERAAEVRAQTAKERGLTERYRKGQLAKQEAEAAALKTDLAKREASVAEREAAADERKAQLEACEANIAKIGDGWRERMGPRSGAWLRIEDELDRGGVVAKPVERPRSAVDELRERSRAHPREPRPRANAGRTDEGPGR